MVAFIDLLGYSNRVRTIETEEDLAALEIDVRRVQRWFDHRTGDPVVRDVQKLQSKKILAFSDCLVIAVPSQSELADQEGDFDIVMGEIVAFAYAQGLSAVNGIFLRGGLDYGFWYKRRDTIISPAMVAAYDLERCRAIVPMIAVSDDFIGRFRDHPHREFYSEDEDPFPRYLREFELPGGLKQWMIDYFPLYLGEIDGMLLPSEHEQYRQEDAAGRDRMRAVAHERDLQRAILAHRDRIVDAHAETTADSVRLKYEWLADYHDDALRRFLREPPEEALIGGLGDR